MRITRIYNGDDGRAHLEELAIAEHEVMVNGFSSPSASFAVQDAHFNSFADCDMARHNAGRRQLIVVLAGSIEFECADGVVYAGPGDVVLAEDTEGEGHLTRLRGNVRTASLGLPGERR